MIESASRRKREDGAGSQTRTDSQVDSHAVECPQELHTTDTLTLKALSFKLIWRDIV